MDKTIKDMDFSIRNSVIFDKTLGFLIILLLLITAV